MAVDDLGALSIDELIGRYQRVASKHGEAAHGPDASVANSDADMIAAVYRELRRRSAERTLLVLLESPDLGVRSWAAAHAMEFAPDQGEPVLTALSESGVAGPIRLGAEMTLREWRAGRLRFP